MVSIVWLFPETPLESLFAVFYAACYFKNFYEFLTAAPL